ncbi:MAG TPA: hypothetical protein PLS37_05935, partial [Propioniciclava tarda]|nr:hypothetical protein [Propioniciclava tarda]
LVGRRPSRLHWVLAVPEPFGVDKSSITLAPGGSATLTISYANAAGSDANSMSQAQLHLGDAAHAALWGMSK